MFKKIFPLVLAFTTLSVSAYTTYNPYDYNVKVRCKDGSYSTSRGSGTCSWHGGIR